MFLAGTLVAGCGGGSTPPSPVAQPTATPGSITTLVALPGTAGTLALPAIGGITPSFGIAAGAPAGVTLTAIESLSAPPHAPIITASTARKAASATTVAPFLFISVTFSATVPPGVVSSEILALTGLIPVSTNYFCEVDDITGGSESQLGVLGPVTASSTVTFSNGSGSGSPGLAAGHTYLFQFYSLPVPAPTPTPTVTPTPAATPTPTATPTSSATPTATPSPSTSPTITPTPTPTGTATPVPAFTFSGPSASAPSVVPPAVPAAIVVPASGAYGTYGAQATIAWGASSGSSAFSLGAALGSNSSDISPFGQFPIYTGSAATPLFYLLLSTTAAVDFAQSPAVTVTVTHGFPSSNTCGLYVYSNGTGNGPNSWQLVPGAQANVSGSSVTIPAVSLGTSTADLAPGKTTLAFIGC
jgi:hypothetical protein